MAKPMPVDQLETNGQAMPPVQAGIVEEFARTLSRLSADQGCQRITSLVSEMDDLRAKNEELQRVIEKSSIAETSTFARIQKVMNDKQEVDRRCCQKDADLERCQRQACEAEEKLRLAMEEVVALKKELKSTNEEVQKAMVNGKKQELLISGLNGSIAKLQESEKQAERDRKDAAVEQAQAKKLYDAASQELQAFKQRAFPLQPTSDSALNEHKRQLRDLLNDVFHLVHRFFGHLQLESLETVEGKWQKFTEDHALTAIPLPRSNSASATQMRVAAVLRLVSKMACAYIFQPVYLTPEGMEVAEIIDRLGTRDAEWVRSAFLNIDRKQQQAYGMKRADIASSKIVELVGILMTSTADTQDLEMELRRWCQKASILWMTLQILKPRIEAELEFQVTDEALVGWRSFPEPLPKDRNSTAGGQNGVKSKPVEKNQLVIKDIATGVWPRFLATADDEHSDLLMPGFALLKAQTLTASQELEAAILRRDSGSHRATHGKQRVVRTVMEGANESTERLSFLSQKPRGEATGLATGGAKGL